MQSLSQERQRALLPDFELTLRLLSVLLVNNKNVEVCAAFGTGFEDK